MVWVLDKILLRIFNPVPTPELTKIHEELAPLSWFCAMLMLLFQILYPPPLLIPMPCPLSDTKEGIKLSPTARTFQIKLLYTLRPETPFVFSNAIPKEAYLDKLPL